VLFLLIPENIFSSKTTRWAYEHDDTFLGYYKRYTTIEEVLDLLQHLATRRLRPPPDRGDLRPLHPLRDLELPGARCASSPSVDVVRKFAQMRTAP
jgi:hypothetical protein